MDCLGPVRVCDLVWVLNGWWYFFNVCFYAVFSNFLCNLSMWAMAILTVLVVKNLDGPVTGTALS